MINIPHTYIGYIHGSSLCLTLQRALYKQVISLYVHKPFFNIYPSEGKNGFNNLIGVFPKTSLGEPLKPEKSTRQNSFLGFLVHRRTQRIPGKGSDF